MTMYFFSYSNIPISFRIFAALKFPSLQNDMRHAPQNRKLNGGEHTIKSEGLNMGSIPEMTLYTIIYSCFFRMTFGGVPNMFRQTNRK